MFTLIRGNIKIQDENGDYFSTSNPLPVTTSPESLVSSSAPSRVLVGILAVSIIVANTNRGLLIIQNVGTTIIYLTFGLVAPTNTIYHVALKPGIVADDGLGATLITDEWKGDIQGISSAVGGLVVVMEASP